MSWLRDNGLSITLFVLFAITVIGQGCAGWIAHNENLLRDGGAGLTLVNYLTGAQFGSTLFENWESEFLKMATYVILTAYLFQRGSPESKDPDEKAPQDRDPKADENKPDAPWPVRAGGLTRTVYAHSLGLCACSPIPCLVRSALGEQHTRCKRRGAFARRGAAHAD